MRGPSPALPTPVTLITHETTEEAIRAALDAIHKDGNVSETPQMIRIEPHVEPQSAARGRHSMATSESKSGGLERVLVGEVARVTEAAAIAAARLRGRGDEKAADKAAVDAMRSELGKVHIRGRVVIGEGEMDESPMLYIGEEVGIGDGPEVDIAVDPLEGTTICAKAMPNALAVLAIAERGGLLNAPDMYMNKIAIGPGYPEGIIDLDAPPAEMLDGAGQGQGRAGLRDHGLHPRPAAPCRADRGRAQAPAPACS